MESTDLDRQRRRAREHEVRLHRRLWCLYWPMFLVGGAVLADQVTAEFPIPVVVLSAMLAMVPFLAHWGDR